ncbi:GAF domain-containing protein [Nonomuraea maritima]|uniref:GAF domain-containing protein n=1 Tax=Nonomuraea maritima TaxID=683260 RepID=A0A1G9JY17_9ACTN|nr:GAF and ANTAR domain-containing protein [Nonomuraea maritima]SDL42487.1 GAF domain-containing protein [Nonomuraea maritima]
MAHDGETDRPAADGHARHDDLAVTLTELARTLREEPGVQETLDGIVAAAVDTVPGTRYAGLMVVEGRRHVDTRAVTAEVVRLVDQAQYDVGEGPCLDCLDAVHERRTVRLPDMTAERRWPLFARRAIELRIMSMLSFQLYVRRDILGALNLYSREVGAFDDESEHVGLLFAAHAAVAMSGAQHEEHLVRAVAMRDLIGQAKGILMERHRVTAEQAFALLVRASQQTNTRLADIAQHLVDTGELSRRRP